MADAPINFNRARKQRARQVARKTADENSARFGRPKAERQAEQAKTDLAARRLDGHRREDGDDAAS